jgi:cytochrome c5
MPAKTLFVLAAVTLAAAARAQPAQRTVADGVYSDAQASRGAAAYESACSGCHRADFGGGTGPALKQQRFAQVYAGKDLRALFTKIATTMPRGVPASLADDVYLDIVAHVLKENGFRAGAEELSIEALDGIRVVPGRPKPLPAVGDFSYVEVVGCLTAGPRRTWLLTRATDPVAALPTADPAAATTARTLGSLTFHLVDAAAYGPDAHSGQKVYVRWMLIKLPDEQRMTISAFERVSTTCDE